MSIAVVLLANKVEITGAMIVFLVIFVVALVSNEEHGFSATEFNETD